MFSTLFQNFTPVFFTKDTFQKEGRRCKLHLFERGIGSMGIWYIFIVRLEVENFAREIFDRRFRIEFFYLLFSDLIKKIKNKK